MNTAKRQELENKMKNVKVTLQVTETVMGNTQITKKPLELSNLTNKEISQIYSNFSWGVTNGIVINNDRTNDASLKWEA